MDYCACIPIESYYPALHLGFNAGPLNFRHQCTVKALSDYLYVPAQTIHKQRLSFANSLNQESTSHIDNGLFNRFNMGFYLDCRSARATARDLQD
jgi:hypothetical protein